MILLLLPFRQEVEAETGSLRPLLAPGQWRPSGRRAGRTRSSAIGSRLALLGPPWSRSPGRSARVWPSTINSITGDPRIQEASAHNVSQIFQHTFGGPTARPGSTVLHHPLISFQLRHAGKRAQPAGYHWINFLLHAVNVLLVFGLSLHLVEMASRIVRSRSRCPRLLYGRFIRCSLNP